MSHLHGEAAQQTLNLDQATVWQTVSMQKEKGTTAHVCALEWSVACMYTGTRTAYTHTLS